MSYGCKCQCESFKQHVGLGPYVGAAARPTNAAAVDTKFKNDTEARWAKENDAYKRLVKEGHNPPRLNGIDIVEKYATTKTEIAHGKVYGETAKLRERIANGETAA